MDLRGCGGSSDEKTSSNKDDEQVVEKEEEKEVEEESKNIAFTDSDVDFINTLTTDIQVEFPSLVLTEKEKKVNEYSNASYLQIELFYSDPESDATYRLTYTNDLKLRGITAETNNEELGEAQDVFIRLVDKLFDFEEGELLDTQMAFIEAEVTEKSYSAEVRNYSFYFSSISSYMMCSDLDVVEQELPYNE